jgi:hypothetical protein
LGILQVYEDLFKQGSAEGITFVASSGDLGAFAVPAAACFIPRSTSQCGRFKLSVITPASSPHVTGVGGTNLVTTFQPPSLNSAYVKENAFPDRLAQDIFYGTPARGGLWASGGGISIFFKEPPYQLLVNSPSKYRTSPTWRCIWGMSVRSGFPMWTRSQLRYRGHCWIVLRGKLAPAPHPQTLQDWLRLKSNASVAAWVMKTSRYTRSPRLSFQGICPSRFTIRASPVLTAATIPIPGTTWY